MPNCGQTKVTMANSWIASTVDKMIGSFIKSMSLTTIKARGITIRLPAVKAARLAKAYRGIMRKRLMHV